MTMERRMQELIAVGAAVGANCSACLGLHVRQGIESGATKAELAAAVEIGRAVRGGAASSLDRAAARLGAAPSGPETSCGCAGSPAGEG